MISERRIRQLNKISLESKKQGAILYWMDRELRVHDNWALLYAISLAKKDDLNLVVVYCLVPNFLGGTLRQLDFKIKSLLELKNSFSEKNIPFYVLNCEGKNDSENKIIDFVDKNNISAVVTDFSPLKIQRHWKEKVAKKIEIPFYEVDAHNIVPVWVTSDKQEFAAYTIRPKIKRQVAEFLVDFPAVQSFESKNLNKKYEVEKTDLNLILEKAGEDRSVLPVDWIVPGEKAGKKGIKDFIQNRLGDYAEKRNLPNENFQSNLSPYLHYGNIAPGRVVLEVLKSCDFPLSNLKKLKAEIKMGLNLHGIDKNVDAFLEELIFRRELADNYCFYNENYDNSKGFPDWAIKTLEQVKGDKREYIYTKKEFEEAKTHDELWNAAQSEMVKTGKMHGYMRMYWAKKILEWTPDVATAQKIAIYLNDKYELDGRDPNGYTGIAWSIGGVHDRAWFKRPIFGQIRYMAYSGMKSKFKIAEYINRNKKTQEKF